MCASADPLRGDPQERERTQRLRALDDPRAWRAAVLALTLTPESELELRLWRTLVADLPGAVPLFDDVSKLWPSQRLPWFEHFARLLAPRPVAQRHELIGAARSLLTADGLVSSMDQLRWIALRHLLAGSAVAAPAAAPTEFETLDRQQVHAICVYCGFLSTLVPTPEINFDPTGYDSVSQNWYDRVTAPWIDHCRRAGPPGLRHRRRVARAARAASHAVAAAADAGAQLVRRRARAHRRAVAAPRRRRRAALDPACCWIPRCRRNWRISMSHVDQ